MVYISEDSRKSATTAQIEFYENFFNALEGNPLDSTDVDKAYMEYRGIISSEWSVGIVSDRFLTDNVEKAYRKYSKKLPWRRCWQKSLSTLTGIFR
jgi:hypothetical protein